MKALYLFAAVVVTMLSASSPSFARVPEPIVPEPIVIVTRSRKVIKIDAEYQPIIYRHVNNKETINLMRRVVSSGMTCSEGLEATRAEDDTLSANTRLDKLKMPSEEFVARYSVVAVLRAIACKNQYIINQGEQFLFHWTYWAAERIRSKNSQ